MANSILKLSVESKEYDAKLKKAAEGILHLAEVAHRGASEMTGLDKSEIDFIKSLGDMETKSRTAAGQVRELEKTFKDLKVVYNQLNDVEKADEGGKALAASLERIKERLNESKAQLAEVNKEISNSGGILAQLKEKFTINIDALTLFNAGLQAAEGALNVAKEAFFASEAHVDSWGRTVASAESVYEGFLNALNNMDVSGFLSRIDEIVTAARAAYNELDRLGTMKTIQAPQVSAQQTENERIRMMIQTGRYIAPVDGRSNAVFNGKQMQNGQLLTAAQIRGLEQQLQNGMNKVVTLVGNEVKQTTKAIDAVYKRQGAELGMSVKEFRKGTSSMAEFEKRLAGAEKYNEYERQHTNMQFSAAQGRYVQKRDNTQNPYEQYKGWDVFRVDGDRYKQLVQLIQQRDQQAAQAYSMQSQAYRAINRAEGTTVRSIMNGGSGGSGGGTTTPKGGNTPDDVVVKAEQAYADAMKMAQRDLMEGIITSQKYDETIYDGQKKLAEAYNKAYEETGNEKYLKAYQETSEHVTDMQRVVDANIEAQKAAEKAARELEAAQKRLADAQNELAEAQATGDLKAIYAAEKKVETAQVQVDARTGSGAGEAIAVPITISNLDALKQHLTEEMATTPVGDSLLHNMQEAFSDASAIGTIFSTAVKNGIDTASFDTSGIMEKLLNNKDIDDEQITSYVEQLNEQLKMKFDETEWPNVLITFNAETKQIENAAKKQLDDAKKTQQAWGLAAQSVNNLSTALANIEDPGAKAMGTVIKAIADISLGFAQASVQASSLGPWGWLAWLAAGTAAMATTISSVHSLTGFAEGGIIKGNSYSGDRIGGMVDGSQFVGLNAGELVLNKSQQMNLASQLEGGGMGGLHLSTVVTAEDIKFILNNNGERIGVGEYFEP